MKTDANFEARDKTLKDVLFSTNRYSIPRFQRPYSWDIDQISEFWEDINNSDDQYFFGSFIFNNQKEKQNGYSEIIDGQQRLLTITIFIAALRDVAKSIDPSVSERYQRQDIAIEDREGNLTFRINPSDTLMKYFNRYIQNNNDDIKESKPSTKEEKKIKNNYEYFHKHISEIIDKVQTKELKIDKLNRLRNRVADLIVIDIEISKEEDAYEIFETTNARGIDLSIGDLLKNLILMNISVEKEGDIAKDIWQEMTNDVEETDTELKRFLRYYWISKYNFTVEKKVYKEVKQQITDWRLLLDDLRENAKIYNKLLEGGEVDFQGYKHGSRIYKSLQALRMMRVSQCYVLLMAILRNIEKLQTDPVGIFELIEKFTFQYSVVCKLPGNKVEKIYSKYAIKLENTIKNSKPKKLPGDIQSIFASLATELKNEGPSKLLFKESFIELSYRNSDQVRMLVKYILAKIEAFYSKTDEKVPDFTIVNIEHLLPVTPSKSWGLTKKEIKDYVNLIGNLTLVSKIINSKLQNGTIAEKIGELETSQMSLTKNIVQELKENKLTWNEKLIKKRQDNFADLSFDVIWKV